MLFGGAAVGNEKTCVRLKHQHFDSLAKCNLNQAYRRNYFGLAVNKIQSKANLFIFLIETRIVKMSDSEDLDSDIEEGMDVEASASGYVGNTDTELLEDTDDSDSSDEEGDSDENDNDEDEDAEAKLMQRYLEILSKINDDKYNYDCYVELVDVAQYVFGFECASLVW